MSVLFLLTLAVNKINIFILFLYITFSIHPILFIACLWIFSFLKKKTLAGSGSGRLRGSGETRQTRRIPRGRSL
ncbi:hypothetical protein AV530_018295 [Patagioenas fasciata monilis]|uniref:Uncharacterized protein n=1 Tax=Patagioenas fasciata monilis TaxID=372326 RepID=A0A1V4JSR2_PATFA|nr:hypothetical protein AV530_018295 [Patagioenas fasciata monilis]